MKRLGIAGFLLAILAVRAAAAWAGESPKYGGRLILGISKDIVSLNPFYRTQSTDSFVRELVFQTLLDLDERQQPIPALADSWSLSKDEKTYTFRLRRGVRFHNGKELTAEDVKWSIEYALDPQNQATGLTLMRNIQEARAKDKYTVEIALKRPQAAFLVQVSALQAFVVVPKDSIPSGKPNLGAFPAGTGPFVYKDYKVARELILTRNRDYWHKGLPYIDELVLKPVIDDQVRFLSLRSGDLDMIERTPYAFVRKIAAGEMPGIQIAEAKYAGFRRLVFNVTQPPFNNIKIRQAVLHAFDAREFLKGAHWGFGEPATVWGIPKTSPWFVKGLNEIKRDPEKVKALLKEAGAGPDLEVVIIARTGEEEENIILQQQLTTAGIRTKVDYLEHARYVSLRRNGQFQMVLSGAEPVVDPGDSYPFRFGCDEPRKGPKRILNYSGYCNEEFDNLVLEAGQITDVKKRYELYAKAIRIIHRDLPEAPFVFTPRFFTFNQHVKGFEAGISDNWTSTTGGLLKTWVTK
ncbi:MAG: ABC transporter substrate-binding protein [Candidatus Binatia bacterium]